MGLIWIGSDWIEFYKMKSGSNWVGLDWIGLGWIGLDWIGLDRTLGTLELRDAKSKAIE